MSDIDPRLVEPTIGALQAMLRLRDVEIKVLGERIAEFEAKCAQLAEPRPLRSVPRMADDAAE